MIELVEICLVFNLFTLILEIVIHIIQKVVFKFLYGQKLLGSQRISNIDLRKQLFCNSLIEQVHLIALILATCQQNVLGTKGDEHYRTGQTKNHGCLINFILLILSHHLHRLHLFYLLISLSLPILLQFLILNLVFICPYLSLFFFWVT